MNNLLLEQATYAEQLIHNSMDCICTTDINNLIIEFNPAAENMFGFTKGEVAGKNVEILYHSKDEFKRVNDTIEADGYFKGEIKNQRKNGEAFVSFLSSNRIHDENGKATGTMGISREISTQKTLEKKFGQIIKKATDVIYTTDDRGRFTFLSESLSNVVGYNPDDLIGAHFTQIIHPEDREQVIEFYMEQFMQQIPDTYYECRVVRKDGTVSWIGQNVSLVALEHKNKPGFQAIVRDITTKKAMELALIESENNFRQINENIDDVFYLYNRREKGYEYISPNCEGILGVKPEAFYSLKAFWDQFVHPYDKPVLSDAEYKISVGLPFDIEYRVIVDGEIKWIREKSFPVKDEQDNPFKVSGVCSDISKQKEAEETIREQNKSIGSSIDYSKRIQDATLPTRAEFRQIFPESFVFYRPKDKISGDFYVVGHLETERAALPAFVVADCTGHGVPGGILSILCNSLIQRTFSNHSIGSPAHALSFVKDSLSSFFISHDSNPIKDGMDVSYCVLDEQTMQLHFAGANTSCLIVRNGEVIEIKGDRQHVGYAEYFAPYTNHVINVKKGDNIYLSTDGFIDQFGGPKNKKFMRKRFKELLISVHQKSINVQEMVLKREFQNWKNGNEQTDDVCVFGIRL